jgi:hypothetical protein
MTCAQSKPLQNNKSCASGLLALAYQIQSIVYFQGFPTWHSLKSTLYIEIDMDLDAD